MIIDNRQTHCLNKSLPVAIVNGWQIKFLIDIIRRNYTFFLLERLWKWLKIKFLFWGLNLSYHFASRFTLTMEKFSRKWKFKFERFFITFFLTSLRTCIPKARRKRGLSAWVVTNEMCVGLRCLFSLGLAGENFMISSLAFPLRQIF